MPSVEIDMLLSTDKRKTAPKLQQEFLQVVDKPLFQIGFVKTRVLL